jgi:hypothetical protein
VHGSKTTRIGFAAIAVCIAVGTFALAGCGGGSGTDTTGASGVSGASGAAGSAQVSASDFMASVCPAFVGLQSTVAKQEAAFQQAISGEKDPVAGKKQVVTLTSGLSNSIQQSASTIKAAGTPDVPNGDQIKSQLDTYLDQYMALFQQAETQVHALPTSSIQALNSAAGRLIASLQQKRAQLQVPNLLDSSELKQAAEQTPACQPLLQGG